MKFTTKTRDLVLERAHHKCEICGSSVSNPNLHHRKPRGMGGTKNPDSRSPANALYLHFQCHAWVESNREKSYDLGYLVKQQEQSDKKPVLTYLGWVLLHHDGTTTTLEEAWDSEGKPVPRHSLSLDN